MTEDGGDLEPDIGVPDPAVLFGVDDAGAAAEIGVFCDEATAAAAAAASS